MKKQFFTSNPSQTKKAGELLAKEVIKDKLREKALVIGLVGDLGGGKTTFLQGFARGLGIKEKILSPTFIIMRRFPLIGGVGKNFYHIDCYRIKKPEDLLILGFKEVLAFPQNIIAIEWAERAQKIMPKNTIWLDFKFMDKGKRRITRR